MQIKRIEPSPGWENALIRFSLTRSSKILMSTKASIQHQITTQWHHYRRMLDIGIIVIVEELRRLIWCLSVFYLSIAMTCSDSSQRRFDIHTQPRPQVSQCKLAKLEVHLELIAFFMCSYNHVTFSCI